MFPHLAFFSFLFCSSLLQHLFFDIPINEFIKQPSAAVWPPSTLLWNVGVTDVTKNCRLFAVASTTCSTLLLLAVCVETDFSTHHHPAHPVPVPIRHPRDSSSVAPNFETDIYTSQVQQPDTRYIRGILMYVASGLFSWSMAAGLVAFSSRQFAPTINHGPPSASHNASVFPSFR